MTGNGATDFEKTCVLHRGGDECGKILQRQLGPEHECLQLAPVGEGCRPELFQACVQVLGLDAVVRAEVD